MLFGRPVLDAIVAGEVTLAFRRWDLPRVRPGTRLRTAVGVLEVLAVDEVDPGAVTPAQAKAAGVPLEQITAPREDRALYRIALRRVGDDPRAALRESVPDTAGVRHLIERLAEIERRGRRDPWTRAILELIAANPARRAPELAAELGRDTLPFKRDVRVLKELGLTESLPVGYRLSPRGSRVLRALRSSSRQR
ncbi:MAG: hypothetical protein M3070_09175 [Actinomycetota bacterium]|nr:hypothetical protein [Actinomycetota bacterium]